MFCPSCGLENAQSQKFCRRCGTNLLALQAASEMLTDMTVGSVGNQLDPKFLLKLVALIGTLGFFFVTGGAVALTLVQLTSSPEAARNDPPLGMFLAMSGYTALTLICWMLLRFARQMRTQAPPMVFNKPVNQQVPAYSQPVSALPPATQGVDTNPALGAAPAYQSIIEDETKQFVNQPRNQ